MTKEEILRKHMAEHYKKCFNMSENAVIPMIDHDLESMQHVLEAMKEYKDQECNKLFEFYNKQTNTSKKLHINGSIKILEDLQ